MLIFADSNLTILGLNHSTTYGYLFVLAVRVYQRYF